MQNAAENCFSICTAESKHHLSLNSGFFSKGVINSMFVHCCLFSSPLWRKPICHIYSRSY